jgi:hypothetical protein
MLMVEVKAVATQALLVAMVVLAVEAQAMVLLCQPMAEQQHLVKAMQVDKEIVLLVFSIAQAAAAEQEPQVKLYLQHQVVVEMAE